MMPTPDRQKCEETVHSFIGSPSIPALDRWTETDRQTDRRTDGRTELLKQHSALHALPSTCPRFFIGEWWGQDRKAEKN